MFLRKCSSRERKTKAEGSFHPRATGNTGGARRSQKLQYIVFTSEEFQRDQPKLRKPNLQGEIQKWNTEEWKKQGSVVLALEESEFSRRGWHRETVGHTEADRVPPAPPVLRGAHGPAQRQRHNNYLNQVWHKEENAKSFRAFIFSRGPPDGDGL